MAIIDILTPYDAKKKAAHAAKTVKHGVSEFPISSGPAQCSTSVPHALGMYPSLLPGEEGEHLPPSYLPFCRLLFHLCPAWPGNKHNLFFPGVVWPLGPSCQLLSLGATGRVVHLVG